MSQAGRKSNQVAVEVRPDALDAAGTDRAHRLLSFVAERLSAPIAWFSVGDGRAERLVTSLGLEASVLWMLEGPMVEGLREPEPFCVADTASDPRFRALARASSRGSCARAPPTTASKAWSSAPRRSSPASRSSGGRCATAGR